MDKRPVAVTIIGGLYIAVGAIGFATHLAEFKADYGFLLVQLLGLAAVVSGIWLLRGRNWARWLALAWMACHVVVSAFHTLPKLALHTVFLAILAYFLFRPAANRYFHAAAAGPPQQAAHGG